MFLVDKLVYYYCKEDLYKLKPVLISTNNNMVGIEITNGIFFSY